MKIIFSDYIKYKAKLRKFDFNKIENILRFSTEKYFDTTTHRLIAIGKHDNMLVMIPYEKNLDNIIPITIHATSRQQIKFRIKTGRFVIE